MIKSDKEYSITRYWRDVFHRSARELRDFEQNAMEILMAASYDGTERELEQQMEVYLTETGKKDEDFPAWTPEGAKKTAVLIIAESSKGKTCASGA